MYVHCHYNACCCGLLYVRADTVYIYVYAQAPGGFPDSDQPSQLHRSSSQPAGKQLETARTAVPVQVDRSNAAAASPTATTNGEQKSAGEQLQPARNAVPTDIQDSNAATSQVIHRLALTSNHIK